ncbi:hypothetical protein ALC62_09280 [Cyphomyrmex costatus]|uniref:Mutator-like transposase domain-containing protein n=1 Tax=Cyphomyrmex costatus TaxID=456900 RepID=A0A151IFM6_9HYME|nr:hypothetical protein ALC62_09280 [Cyphomyrmex costatus]
MTTEINVPEDGEKHYRIIDFLLIFTTLSTLVKCSKCDGKIEFQSCRMEGLGFEIQIKCDNCKMAVFIPSSEKIGRMYEVNYRFTFVMRLLGLGLAGCDKFCGLMDLSSNFVSKSVYNLYIKNMCEKIQSVVKRLYSMAAAQEKNETCKENELQDTTNLTVSGDGMWQKRGFSSLYGVSSLIGYYTGKVLDICVKSGICQKCKIWESKLNTVEFEEWHKNHVEFGECEANHVGPAGNMEVSAMIEMFQRSEENHGVKYKYYIGDGDSKMYTGVIQSQPYGEDFIIHKKECVGHVQKRMGKRLPGQTRRSKSLSGKGKLTAKIIDKLTVYYGLAIRRNCESVIKMNDAIWATFFHYKSTDEDPQHDKCPAGADSWCDYQKALATTGVQDFQHKYEPFPDEVIKAIEPIYQDLSKDELLQRCVGGFNQNNNESLNQLIWRISPKILSSSPTIIEIAANVAACTFNEGYIALLAFLQEMKISVGLSAHHYVRNFDKSRISKAEEKAALVTKEARILKRMEQKDALDIAKAAGTLLYGAGIDDSM